MVSSGSSGLPLQLNTWEDRALDVCHRLFAEKLIQTEPDINLFRNQYEFPAQPAAQVGSDNTTVPAWIQLPDPIIYPGIYSASGIDVMGILLRVASRPNPCIELGPLDCSVSLTLCDLSVPNAPIVYASPGFYQLTGYSPQEIMGRNCRFLQHPPHPQAGSRSSESLEQVAEMGRAIRANKEVRVEVLNYKKNGKQFTNVVTILPLWPDSSGHHYAVGFQAEL
ncbi:pas domain-containing [Trichoderma arundinaceum]|uniref:Pas domain-containing n=1 Tax=Trichoderma arundinaceum TaxID=490622 RepID=A0A395NQ96_TRIAR|nr:pas domain-containing [Trichoderma arundinaceum]